MPNTPTSTLEPPRIAYFLLAVVVAIGAAGAGCAQVSPYEGRNATVFTNVNVLPMDSERVLAEQTVVVVDGRIADMGAASEIAVPSDSTVIVGTGQYLMPGLTEMHGHLPSSFLARDDIPLEEITEIVLFLYVANGVTLVRGMQGDESHLELRDRIEAQDLLGPHLLVSAPMLHGRQVTDPDQAAELVRGYAARGFDHLKVHEELSLDVYDAIAATANEVGLRFSGHVSNKVGLQHALDAGQATIDHLDNYVETLVADATPEELQGTLTPVQLIDRVDESGIAAMVEATRAAGAAVVPTLVLWETFMGEASGDELTMLRPEVRYMPPYEIDRWTEGVNQRLATGNPEQGARVIDLRRRLLKALHAAGVAVLLGTDSPQLFSVPGFSMHREMRTMVDAGLTPYDVLDSGTRAVAALMEREATAARWRSALWPTSSCSRPTRWTIWPPSIDLGVSWWEVAGSTAKLSTRGSLKSRIASLRSATEHGSGRHTGMAQRGDRWGRVWTLVPTCHFHCWPMV